MKKLFWIAYVIGIIFLISCEKGTTTEILNSNEYILPDELKGLRVYKVSTGGLDYVKVAVLNNTVNSLTYPVGKTTASTIMVNSQNNSNIKYNRYTFGFDIYINFIDGSVRTVPNDLNVIREFDIIQEGDTCKFREFDIKTKSMI